MTDDQNRTNDKNQFDPNRRNFLKNTGIFAGGLIGGSVVGGLLFNQTDSDQQLVEQDGIAQLQDARVFFDRKEDFEVLAAATERIFPKDDYGPGAIELAVPYYIDKQLNSAWGTNSFEYMDGPFPQNTAVREFEDKDIDKSKQGPNADVLPNIPAARYQTRLNRGDIFLHGLRAIEEESVKQFDESFINLDGEQQDEILTTFDEGQVALPGVSSETFFNLLVQMTIEGAYADPVYGGNKNMMGWKMKEYPGPRASYLSEIESEDFIVMEQKSLRDYQG